MAQDKKSFILYCSFISTFEELSDEEAGRLIKHVFRYVNDEDPTPPDRITKITFEPIKQHLKMDLKKYESKRLKNSENIKKRWNKENTNVYDRIEENTNDTDNGIVIGIDNGIVIDSVNVKKKESIQAKAFSPENEFYPFSEFWNDYDKKVGDRAKLEKKWTAVPISDRRLIKSYIPIYKISEPNKKFRKNPDTFLNNKSWNDEIIKNDPRPVTIPSKQPFKQQDHYD